MNKYKEFIKEIYKEEGYTSEQLKLKMEYRFPKLFKDDNIILNNWYKWNGFNKAIGFISKEPTHANCYEFDYLISGKTNSYDSLHKTNLVKATKEEVFEAFKNELNKRGFKDGVSYFGVMGSEKDSITKIGERGFLKYDLKGVYCGNSWILFEGQWATPLPTITKEQAEKELNKIIID